MPDWSSLPPAVRTNILKLLTHHKNTAAYATVSEEWRDVIEEKNFGYLSLPQWCVDSLARLSERPKRRIKHILLNIELQRYTCQTFCQKQELSTWYPTANDKIMAEAMTKLFFILANWEQHEGGLTLELNAYSPSDREHFFQNCYVGAPDEDELDFLESEGQRQDVTTATAIYDPSHGRSRPGDDALRPPPPTKLVTLEFRKQLPLVPAVTKFILRRQCRRHLNPSNLSYLWSKLPQLEEITYEPWQLSADFCQRSWDLDYKKMISQGIPTSVKKVTIFEDFNDKVLDILRRLGAENADLYLEWGRTTSPEVGAALATKSRPLESLSVAFLADAYDFFAACQSHWQWDQLRSLTLTSRRMYKDTPFPPSKLLETAAQSALHMPKLETLTLWNGAKEEACAFTWCRQNASISWRGTWDLELEPTAISAWKKVARKYARRQLRVNRELLTQEIRSHGDAIHYLGLHSVVSHTSLQQIRKEKSHN